MDAKEASDLVEAAINQAMKSNENYDPDDILVDWVAVGFCANPDKEKGGCYPMLFSNGLMPDYRVRGLLIQALLET